ncbi:hypothetical protein [Aquimarina sp. 2201CG5-10]|uniref:hypothetical protein n=1 Tax=Aquimarina callyspongiae TaxID=3098150 RepID=UPI002AB344A4|nr:hypothetical protein [Aquimarina sp. 2201CG5-10]MDY8135818.1 hypothetical protein [Aquimarina sp. 2201CG5-10]
MKIYYKVYTIIIALCISSFVTAQEQTVIKISEIDQDGRSLDRTTGEVKEEYVNNRIIDINSVLDIELNKTVLIEKIGDDSLFPTELSDKITKIYNALENRNKNMEEVQKLIDTYDFEKFQKQSQDAQNYFTALGNVVQKVDEITEIDDRIEDIADFQFSEMGPYASVYAAAEEVLNELTEEVGNMADENGVYIQFGGWIIANGNQTPLHVPGFDNITPQDPFEVDRWRLMPTPEQLEELKKLQNLAIENRGKEDEILKSIAKNHLDQLRNIIDEKIKKLENKIEEEIEKIKGIGLSAVNQNRFNALVDQINEIKDSIKKISDEFNIRKEYYIDVVSGDQSINVNEFLARIQSDIQYFKVEGKKLLDQINAVANSISAVVGSLSTTIATLKTKFDELKTEYTKRFNEVKNTISGQIEEFLNGEKFDFAALKFSDEVFKFSLDDLPESTSFDLINSGVRADGDQLGFKLEVNSKDGMVYTENRRLFMFRVLPHIEGTVGVIFADPLARTEVKTQFQMAPYYNLILKGLWDQKLRRKSVAYNRIFDWGIGLHISAPDFDGDDVPELGAGIVVSILNDYVQSGAAINVFTGDPYWFFGLRLPVPSFNIGSIPSSN